MASFEIRKKNTDNIWTHNWTDAPEQDLILGLGFFRMVEDVFELYTDSGGQIRQAPLSDIIVQDVSVEGPEETFSTPLDLVTRLKVLDYPYF